MLDKLKRRLGYIKLDEIKIYKEFSEHKPKIGKMLDKMAYYTQFGKFEQPIVLNKFNYLEDGYTSYLIAKNLNWKWVKVKRIQGGK